MTTLMPNHCLQSKHHCPDAEWFDALSSFPEELSAQLKSLVLPTVIEGAAAALDADVAPALAREPPKHLAPVPDPPLEMAGHEEFEFIPMPEDVSCVGVDEAGVCLDVLLSPVCSGALSCGCDVEGKQSGAL